MGLFSSRKHSSAPGDIPADILADVSINGAKKPAVSQTSTASQPSADAGVSANSPFLKSRPAGTPAVPPSVPDSLPVSPASGVGVTLKETAPKPFQFSDQVPVGEEIHFTDTQAAAPKPEAPKPAGERPDFSQITQDKALTEKQKGHLSPLKTKPESVPVPKKSFWSVSNMVSLGVFILILALISGGSWYYLNTRVAEEVPEASIGALEEVIVAEGAPEGSSKTILVDQPNYLTLDIETVTLAQIKEMLAKEGEKMKSEGVTAPVEYLVVDMNSNPVAFARFAILIGAETPSDLVDASLEPFSLYLFLDKGEVRTVLAIALKAEVPANFPVNKGVLPESLKKLFYPEEQSAGNLSTITFSQSSYQNNAIYYANIDSAKNLSFDMTRQEGILTLANSKDALRAVIDKRLLVPEE